MIDVFISGFKCRGTRAWSKGQGLGVLGGHVTCHSTKRPCDVDLRAFKSLPLHYILNAYSETMKILAFTGMPASGKSVAVDIAKEKNIPVVRMGDAVWEETENQGLELNDKNVGKIANDMRDKYGKDVWAKRTVDKIKSNVRDDCVVIDGIRNFEEIDFFKKKLGSNFIVIAILASDETRKKRVLARKREDDSSDVKDLEERDKRELGWGLGEVIASADIVISNEGSIEEFRKKVKEKLARM